jgi:hypothetical protein
MILQRTISALTIVAAMLIVSFCYVHQQNIVLARHVEEQATLIHIQQLQLNAEQRASYIKKHNVRIEATAYALTPDFGTDPLFANTQHAKAAYAVPTHELPTDTVLNVALSPLAEKKLHVKLNDRILLISKRTKKMIYARFVDRTSQTNPVVAGKVVVDIFFRSAHQARIFGRHKDFVAVNINHPDAPFSH